MRRQPKTGGRGDGIHLLMRYLRLAFLLLSSGRLAQLPNPILAAAQLSGPSSVAIKLGSAAAGPFFGGCPAVKPLSLAAAKPEFTHTKPDFVKPESGSC